MVGSLFAILVYDVNESRVNKVNSVCSKYLIWRQNSVFTGKISLSKISLLKEELKTTINPAEDYILIFIFPSNVKFRTEEIGIKRYSDVNIVW